MGIYKTFYKQSKLTRWLLISVVGLFGLSQSGCLMLGASIHAKLKSGKVSEEKGKLLNQSENVLKVFPIEDISLNISLSQAEGGAIDKITVRLLGKSRKEVIEKQLYEKIKIYEKWKYEYYENELSTEIWILLIPVLGQALGPTLFLMGLFGDDGGTGHFIKTSNERKKGKIKKEQLLLVDYFVPIPRKRIYLNCGPAGRYSLTSDENGLATLKLEPLLHRLTKDYNWQITASAEYNDLTAEDSLNLNTTKLGVTWDKPRFQPDLPPQLVASANFLDTNQNQMLDAKETATLTVTVKNEGRGDAFRIDATPELTGKITGVTLSPTESVQIETLPAGEKKTLDFTLKADEEVPAQRLRVRMKFRELNGFEPPPLVMNLSTRPYAPPKLTLAKWMLDDDNEGMSSGNGNRRLERGEQAEITLYVQNLGAGAAEQVTADLEVSDPNLFLKTLATDLGEIPPGEWRKAVVTLRVNNRYDGPEELPLEVSISERRPKFTLVQQLAIPLGKDLLQEKVVMLPGDQPLIPEPELKPLPEDNQKASLTKDDFARGERYAMLIGINSYIDTDLRPLQYAEGDIHALYSVLIDPNIGKYDSNNVFVMTPRADQPQDRPTRNNILLTLKWMTENLKPEDSLLFAFCGHGDTEKNINFVIPLDGRLALPQDTSIRLDRLFEWFDACPARRQVVMLDACHSGGLTSGSRGTRDIGIVARSFAKEVEKAGQVVGRAVLAACSKDEVSYEDSKMGHGVFSYYVLQGLQRLEADTNTDRKVTVYELGTYVRSQVELWCKRYRKSPSQTPRMVYNDMSGEIVLVGKEQ